MTEPKLLIERHGSIALLTLNDAATRNSLSPDLVSALTTFLAGANADEGLACIVLTGAGEGFCSGGNVKEMLRGIEPMFAGSPQQMQEAYRAGIQMIPRLFHSLDVPAIAAVNGAAIGAGCDLACMCDIRIASADATFAESFLRVGLVPGDGGAWLLPRVVGYPRALEMALTCRAIEALEARNWGLVTHVVEQRCPARDRIEHGAHDRRVSAAQHPSQQAVDSAIDEPDAGRMPRALRRVSGDRAAHGRPERGGRGTR